MLKVIFGCRPDLEGYVSMFSKAMKKRILIVDDQLEFTGILQRAMREYEFRVESDAKLALDAARQFRPDLFLLDLVMPKMTGTELAEHISHDRQLAHTPIIYLSALVHTKEESDEPVWNDDRPAFGKPFSIERLKRCIDEQISGRKALQQPVTRV